MHFKQTVVPLCKMSWPRYWLSLFCFVFLHFIVVWWSRFCFFVVEIDASFDSKAFWFFKEENRFLQKFQTAFFTHYENVIPVFISNKSYILPRIRGTHGCFLVSFHPFRPECGPFGHAWLHHQPQFQNPAYSLYGLSIPK